MPSRRRAKQKAASGLAPAPLLPAGRGDRTERAAVRKNEERKKHDRLSPRLGPVRRPDRGAEALFYSLKKNKQFIKMC